uniref:Uncharacterized protein n=1 Tax=Angiostrongylus cantonensis TaxID=6313 RepID=A0A0K0DA41_ANGCA
MDESSSRADLNWMQAFCLNDDIQDGYPACSLGQLAERDFEHHIVVHKKSWHVWDKVIYDGRRSDGFLNELWPEDDDTGDREFEYRNRYVFPGAFLRQC